MGACGDSVVRGMSQPISLRGVKRRDNLCLAVPEIASLRSQRHIRIEPLPRAITRFQSALAKRSRWSIAKSLHALIQIRIKGGKIEWKANRYYVMKRASSWKRAQKYF